jgi:adenine deaminase
VCRARALPPYTANPARLLRLPGKGVVAPGADADLVALDAAGAPHTVIVRGQVHVRDGAVARRGSFETAAADQPARPAAARRPAVPGPERRANRRPRRSR